MNVIDMIGMPYEIHGVPPLAADCWSLVRFAAYHLFGKNFPEFMYSEADLLKDAESSIMDETSTLRRWAKHDRPEPGDVVIMRINGHACHCGIMIDDRLFLHTLKGRESCVEPVSGIWKQAIVGFYRYV